MSVCFVLQKSRSVSFSKKKEFVCFWKKYTRNNYYSTNDASFLQVETNYDFWSAAQCVNPKCGFKPVSTETPCYGVQVSNPPGIISSTRIIYKRKRDFIIVCLCIIVCYGCMVVVTQRRHTNHSLVKVTPCHNYRKLVLRV